MNKIHLVFEGPGHHLSSRYLTFSAKFRKVEDGELSKVLRVFRLIELLSAPPFQTSKQLGERLGVSRRTVQRYFGLLEKLGYLIDSDPVTYRHFIQVEKGADDALDFEEAAYLNDTLRLLPGR